MPETGRHTLPGSSATLCFNKEEFMKVSPAHAMADDGHAAKSVCIDLRQCIHCYVVILVD